MDDRQLELFEAIARLQRDTDETNGLDARVICWTRMQAESGEQLKSIVARKDVERAAGSGVFFWGIGNALNVSGLANETAVPVIFSEMLSKPKGYDASPEAVFVWRKYEHSGRVYDLPDHVLVTSRAHTKSGEKRRHYALVCYSDEPLQLRRGRVFDPSAYRNCSERGAPVGFSQVTALLRRVSREGLRSKYFVDLEARLIPPFFVRLVDPVLMSAGRQEGLRSLPTRTDRWLNAVRDLKAA